MKILILLFLVFSPLVHAEKKIAMSEVVTAFTWIKIAPDFPVIFTSQAEDEAHFRVFDDEYSVTRDKQKIKIVKNNEEMANLDLITLEKILKFVKAKKKSEAILNADVFESSIQNKVPPQGFKKSETIFQCKSDLPSRITQNGTVFNQIMQHTWLQNGLNESFGMPNTDEAGYFGGRAHLKSPDSFIGKGPKHLKCEAVNLPVDTDEKTVSKKITCVARTLSLPQSPIFEEKLLEQKWIAHFDYHALKRNCLMAARFVLECSGANAPQNANFGIGGKFDWNDPYSVSEVTPELKTAILNLRDQLNQYRSEKSILALPTKATELMDQALNLDAQLRGVSSPNGSKSLKEICAAALENCPE